MSSDLTRGAWQTDAQELAWAVAVTQRGYAALHPTPELPRPGAGAQAAAVREAFAPAAPVLAARAVGGWSVSPLAVARASDAAFWFEADDDLVVAVVPPFQADGVLDEVAGASRRLAPGVEVMLVVPVGRVAAFEVLAGELRRHADVSAYRSDLQPMPVSAAAEAPGLAA